MASAKGCRSTLVCCWVVGVERKESFEAEVEHFDGAVRTSKLGAKRATQLGKTSRAQPNKSHVTLPTAYTSPSLQNSQRSNPGSSL